MRSHEVTFSGIGDFFVDEKFTFEVGGKNKKFDQIKDIPNSYLAIDGIETGYGQRIPLWMFGFLEWYSPLSTWIMGYLLRWQCNYFFLYTNSFFVMRSI